MAAAPPKSIGLSDHAVTRTIQRVIGVELDLDEALFGNQFCMSLHCYAAGVTRDEVANAVLTPLVRAAIWGGATKIRTAEGVLVVRHGTVITLEPLGLKLPPRQRFQEQSRKEHRRSYRKMGVRNKRRPSVSA